MALDCDVIFRYIHACDWKALNTVFTRYTYINSDFKKAFRPTRLNYITHNHASDQMLSARSLTSCNFFFMSSAPSKLPSSCDAKPHCGETQIRFNASSSVSPVPLATMRAASNTRSLRSSLSSNSGNLLVMRPKTSDLCSGRCFRGSNVPVCGRVSHVGGKERMKRGTWVTHQHAQYHTRGNNSPR